MLPFLQKAFDRVYYVYGRGVSRIVSSSALGEFFGLALRRTRMLRQGSVTGVILVGRSDSLGFHSVTRLVGF